MSTEGGNRAIVAALLANLGIALTKFIAFALSQSSSMLAEGVHSLADAGNQLLLIFGGRQAKKAADKEHPFGYGRERYVYAFVVSIILFSVGGVFSIYEGIEKLNHPHPLDVPWLPMLVLSIAIVLESFSLRTAVQESNHVRGKLSWVQFVRRAKAPELPVVLLEDVAALIGLVFAFIGVGLTWITGNSLFDAIGTLFIGTLLIIVAVVLGMETKSLLVGEGRPEDGGGRRPAERQPIGVVGARKAPHLVELGGVLGRAVRRTDAAGDLDARLQQAGEDGPGHGPGSEEGDRGQRQGRIGTHATILGLAV